jgi:hypothetical protein
MRTILGLRQRTLTHRSVPAKTLRRYAVSSRALCNAPVPVTVPALARAARAAS